MPSARTSEKEGDWLSAMSKIGNVRKTMQSYLQLAFSNKIKGNFDIITTNRLSNNLLTILITNYKKGKQLVTHI